ncbi:hypothetical protein ACFQ3L_06930 [Lacticaseibacillus jixianensis]|uniref:Uncharacterized protein n=1 Tax=Lacticaseibacillus jixianensis TaxID=2486012 RepID=A0ABW4B8T1_9LACO|nr:hypothetical protein [Lacticaseibacillus jixianensis]
MISLDFAFQLDQALKKIVSRVYVIYDPPYRDLRNTVVPSGYEIWVSDPDDVSEAARYFNSDNPEGLGAPAISAKRLAMLAAVHQRFRDEYQAAKTAISLPTVASIERDGSYHGVRVDGLTAEQVAQRIREDDDAAAARTWSGAEAMFDLAVLTEVVLKQVQRQVTGDWLMPLNPNPVVLPGEEVFGDPLPLTVFRPGFAEAFAAHSIARFAAAKIVPEAHLSSGIISDQDVYVKLQLPSGIAYLVRAMGPYQPLRKEPVVRLLVPRAAAFYRWLKIPAVIEQAGEGWQWAEQVDGTIHITPKEVPAVERDPQDDPFSGADAGPADQSD